MRATSGASTQTWRSPARITIPSKMCSFGLSMTRSTVPSCSSSVETIGVPGWSAW